jgi:hypothetical protein
MNILSREWRRNQNLGLIVFSFLVLAHPTFAQPWLSNRFAQNCAGCHAPGRFNKSFSERRCTLSCQGCHVSPNGGGMRSSYGKWTQERWLHTFYVDGLLTNKRPPAPFEKQPYFDKNLVAQVQRKNEALPSPLAKHPMLATSQQGNIDESDYSRKHEYFDFTQVSASTYETLLPVGDPYLMERMFYLSGGADFRYFVFERLNNAPTSTGHNLRAFPMAADLSLRLKPIPNYISLVTEARFLNGPNHSQLDSLFTSEARVRSAYLISDNLPYNSYVMAGLYRPLFGYYTPDHSSLAQTISGLGARSVFLAASIGASPNVPFVNLHLIQPMTAGPDIKGFAANLGGRFVTMGASFMFSYWRTTTTTANVPLIKSMYSATGGLQLGPTTANLDLLHVNQEYAPGLANGGDVITLDTQTRIWRENYLLASIACADIARSLMPGKGIEWQAGFKSYLIAGTDLELLFVNKTDTVSNIDTTTQDIQFQIHLFY